MALTDNFSLVNLSSITITVPRERASRMSLGQHLQLSQSHKRCELDILMRLYDHITPKVVGFEGQIAPLPIQNSNFDQNFQRCQNLSHQKTELASKAAK